MASVTADIESTTLDHEISTGIQQAINASLDNFTLDQTTDKVKTRRQTSALGSSGDISVAEIVTEVVKAIQPMIVQCVTSAISQAVTLTAVLSTPSSSRPLVRWSQDNSATFHLLFY